MLEILSTIDWTAVGTFVASMGGSALAAWKGSQAWADRKQEKQEKAAEALAEDQENWRKEIMQEVKDLKVEVNSLQRQNRELLDERNSLLRRVNDLEIDLKRHESTIERLKEGQQ